MENFKRIWKAAASALVLVALCALPALAQNYPPTWVYARDYNYAAIQSAQASTYTFNGPGTCSYTPTGGSVNGYAPPIFDFSGNVPSVLVGSGAITSGAAILTGVNTTFTSAMVGEYIIVPGAGAGGAPLATTVLSYQSSTQLTLNANASTTVTAATPITVYTPVYFPVAINDVVPTNSEVFTPTATTNGATTCGFSGSPVNSHTTFQLQSGSSGLQEAIAYQSLYNAPTYDVVLDKEWYQLQAGIAGFTNGSTAAQIIAKVTGTTNVAIVDTTTSPWTFYTWNGTTYEPNSSSGSSTAAFTSTTLVAAPSALTTVAATCAANGGGCITTATTGGSIPASGAYTLAATYGTTVGGETLMSIDTASGATVTVGSTTTNTISVSSPAAVAGAAFYRLWMTAASGATVTEILYTAACATPYTGPGALPGACTIGTGATITAIVTGTRLGPSLTGATTSASSAFQVPGGSASPLQGLPVSYAPYAALGTTASAAVGTLGQINLPTGFLNVLGRTVRICGTGYSTTNGTGGTMTFATTLASLFGTTSITPFTVASATIAGSTLTINYTFCETWTTAATGSSGTVEVHGTVAYNVAGTAVTSPAQDSVHAVSSTIDLTKQDTLSFTITPTTAGLTASQLRQLTVEVLQ
jgi:hypothetical protein